MLSTGSTVAFTNKVISIIISFVSVPLILNFLGKEMYGLWMVALSTLAFTSFLDVGLTPTLKNKMAEAFAANNLQMFRHYSSCGLLVALGLFLFGILLAYGSKFIDWASFLNVGNPLVASEARPLIMTVVFLLMTSLALGMVDAIYIASLQIARTKVYSIVATLVSFGFLLAGILYDVSLPALAVLTFGPGLIARLILLFRLRKRDPLVLQFDMRLIANLVKEVLPSSVLFMGIQFFAVVISALPNLLIAKYLSLQDVAVFSIAFKLTTVPLFMIAEILPVFWPAFTIAWTRKETKWLRSRLALITIGTAGGLSFCGVLFTIFGQWGILLWTGDKINVPNDILVWMSLWLVAQGCVYWLSTFLHSISDFAFELKAYGFTAVVLLMLSLALIRSSGLEGVVMASMISVMIASLIPMAWRVRSKLVEY